MRIAYLINQYPKISHSFIRREILALERHGVSIMRISIRGWNDRLVDDADIQERGKTRYVLKGGVLSLIIAFLRLFATHPMRLFEAIVLALKMARRSERPLPIHMIYVAEACEILFWLRDNNIKHLHAHFGTNSAEVAMLVRVLGGPPWSFTVHGPDEFDMPFSLGLTEKIRRAAFVVAISSFGRSQLYRRVEHNCWPKIHVVHCGLDRTFFDISPPLPEPTRRLVCVGRICEQKGQLILLEAAKVLAFKGINFEIVLAGDGDMRAVIEAFIDENALRPFVKITGWINNEQVREHLVAARALVLSSFAEGLPVAIMEAMALRRPIISTNIAGIPELVCPGEHGWLIPAGDVQSLADAMEACLSSEDHQLYQMGQAARARVEARHDANVEAKKLIELFQQTISNNSQ